MTFRVATLFICSPACRVGIIFKSNFLMMVEKWGGTWFWVVFKFFFLVFKQIQVPQIILKLNIFIIVEFFLRVCFSNFFPCKFRHHK